MWLWLGNGSLPIIPSWWMDERLNNDYFGHGMFTTGPPLTQSRTVNFPTKGRHWSFIECSSFGYPGWNPSSNCGHTGPGVSSHMGKQPHRRAGSPGTMIPSQRAHDRSPQKSWSLVSPLNTSRVSLHLSFEGRIPNKAASLEVSQHPTNHQLFA